MPELRASHFVLTELNSKDIYTIAIEAAKAGMQVSVSLITHDLKVNGGFVIEQGHWNGELGVATTDEDSALAMIEDAFAAYERSMPSFDARDSSRWFYACAADRLSDRDMAVGDDRPVARCRLETLVLALILNGSLTAHSPTMRGKWFWQSKKHPKLILLTQWFKNNDQ